MIVQCDECKAKFRLDESRIGAHGAKVRCSKCRHVFMVYPPQVKEEEFDSFLDGLDGGVAATGDVTASGLGGAATSLAAAVPAAGSGVEEGVSAAASDAASDAAGAPSGDEAFSDTGFGEESASFSFGDDLFGGHVSAEDSTAPGEFDFSDLNSTLESEQQGSDMFDGRASEFDFSAETGDVSGAGEDAGWESTVEEVGPFSGEPLPSENIPTEEPAEEAEGRVSAPFDFEDFGATGTPPAEDADSGFGTGSGAAFDFGKIAPDLSNEAAGGQEISSFPSFNLDALPEGREESEPVDDFTFEGHVGSGVGEDMSFELEGRADETAETPLFADETRAPSAFSFDFGGGTMGDKTLASPAGEADLHWDVSPPVENETPGVSDAGHAALGGLADSFGAMAVPPETMGMREELPPLSIATRRKQSAVVPIVATLVTLIVVGGIAAAGYHLFRGGPAAFDRVGLGFVSKWFGIEAKDDGNIAVQKVTGYYATNNEAGELFVVTGEVLNNYRKPRASLQVKAILYGKDGKVLTQKTAFCGNVVSGEQVKTLPWTKIEAAMANQFGDSLSNLGVPPGKGLPFVVVFSQVPKEVTDFAVEAAGSTVAGK